MPVITTARTPAASGTSRHPGRDRDQDRDRALAVAGACAARILVWVIAGPLAGGSLLVHLGPGTAVRQVGAAEVILVSILAGLAGWGLLAVLERFTARAGRTWTVLSLAVLVISLAGPLGARLHAPGGRGGAHPGAGPRLSQSMSAPSRARPPQGARPARRTFTETARRAQIVTAAIDTIAELGFARASFAQIARRPGCPAPGLSPTTSPARTT